MAMARPEGGFCHNPSREGPPAPSSHPGTIVHEETNGLCPCPTLLNSPSLL